MIELERRIREKNATIGVIGLGYVGLPLACLFARKGFTVLGADIKKKRRCRKDKPWEKSNK
jgi:UDP-N-acetyl-D-mannosaminuronate dehydrogenase